MAGDARVPLIVKKMIISWRSFALSMLLCVVVGFSTLAEPLDMFVEAAIGRLGARPVSGDIVVVALDERSLASAGGGDYSPTHHAAIINAVNKAGAKRLFLDFDYHRRENNRAFGALNDGVNHWGDRLVLAVATRGVPGSQDDQRFFPLHKFRTTAKSADTPPRR